MSNESAFIPPVSAEEMEKLNKQFSEGGACVEAVKQEMALAIVGQETLIENLLIGLLCEGHVLVEGVPGLAKTTIVKALAACLQAKFTRVQFTPDLLPSDLLGGLVFNPKTSEFVTRKGPIFTHILLADEINRCAPRVQSALLEAMQEHQVTLGEETFRLEEPFLVMATENPIESEGTYPLPEAQLDRFMFKSYVDYPTPEQEMQILEYIANEKAKKQLTPILQTEHVMYLRELVKAVYMAEQLKRYIVDMVVATRHVNKLSEKLAGLVRYGVSPRATIFLTRAAKAHAFMRGRCYVTPEDIKAVSIPILAHRMILTYEAEAEGISNEKVVEEILKLVPTP